MKRKYFIIAGVAVVILSVVIIVLICNNYTSNNGSESKASGNNSEASDKKEWSKDEFLVDDKESNVDFVAKEVDTKTDSITILVNKEYPLDASYKPNDLVQPNVGFSFDYQDEKRYMRKEAAENLEKMFTAAEYYGHELLATSGFRSYSRQTMLYNYNLVKKGYDYTNVYSAKPGRSEHQTGLAMDITSPSVNKKLTDEFGNTDDGIWVKENCYKYGFVIRYPKGKESITGYAYEPWHVRYVGYDLAKFLFDNDMTLDEYYGYKLNNDVVEREQTSYYDKLLTSSGVGAANNVSEAGLDDIVDEGDVDTVILETQRPDSTRKPETSTKPTHSGTSSPKPTEQSVASSKPTTKPTHTPTPTVKQTLTPHTEAPIPTPENSDTVVGEEGLGSTETKE